MSGPRKDDPWQDIESIKDELYGANRDNGVVGKNKTMWENFLMWKGIFKMCLILLPIIVTGLYLVFS